MKNLKALPCLGCRLLILFLASSSHLSAQTATLSVDSGSGVPGATVTTTVRASASEDFVGFSFALLHDGAEISFLAGVPGAALDSAQGGITPAFFTANATTDPDPSGFTCGMLTDFMLMTLLPATVEHEVVDVSYEILPTLTQPTPLTFGSVGLTSLGVTFPTPAEVTPSVTDGTITPLFATARLPEAIPGSVGATISVPVTISSEVALYGASLNIAHDPAVLTPQLVTEGAAIDNATAIPISNITADGVSFAFLVFPTEPPIPASPQPLEIAVIEYLVVGGEGTSTPLTFSETAGGGASLEVVFDGSLAGDPQLSSGWVQLFPDPEFVRGDATEDGSITVADAIAIFEYLFLDFEPNCIAAIDTDENQQITITDAFLLLNFLFLGGAPPTSPFPACGPGANLGLLGCASAPCP